MKRTLLFILLFLPMLAIFYGVQAQNLKDGHEYVDLGLPSGLLWATCNIGAEAPDQVGYYFAWGEIEQRDVYDWGNYKWGDDQHLTKYNDNKIRLYPEDDAAHMIWGGGWRMPTVAEAEELKNYCTFWLENGIGCVQGPNGNIIKFALTGVKYGNEISTTTYTGPYAHYWLSEVFCNNTDSSPNPFGDDTYYKKAGILYLGQLSNRSKLTKGFAYRCNGCNIRPVCPGTPKESDISKAYRPLVEDGKVWTYHYYNDGTGKSYDVTRVIDGDTIIGGLTYKRICDKNGGNYLYALREEGKQVYIVYNHYETPSLLYDFSKDKGDIVKNEMNENCGLRVADVDTIDIDGTKFRRMRIMEYNYNTQDPTTEWKDEDIPWWATYWIEGVGSDCLLEENYSYPGNFYYLKSCQINGRTYTRQELLKEKTKPEVPYRPFVEEGKVWKVGGVGSNPVQMVDYYYFDGDTIINEKACKQMMRQRYVSPEHPNYDYISQEPSLSYVGAWYEEDKKVYTYDTTYHQFTMMYDFSLEDNGTFQTNGQSYVIGPKQSGGIKGFKGVHRSVMLTADGESIYSTPWLEGVGGLDCPTTNIYPGYVDPAWFLMACVVGDEVIYLNDEYEDGATPDVIGARKQRIDFTHIIKTQPKTRMRQQGGGEEASGTSLLYGEYNERKLGINLAPLDEAYLVLIADETGKAVYEKTINAGNIVGLNIDISTYVKGHYTVTVENSQESFTGEFEVKTTGIEEVRSDRPEAKGVIYDLQGRRLTSKPGQGVYIQSGRLVVVK